MEKFVLWHTTFSKSCVLTGWLGSHMLDSGAEGPGFKSQSRHCRVTVLGKLFTPIVPLFTIHHAAKLIAALLRVAGVTADLEESNDSLPGLWFTSPAGWLPRTGISSGTVYSRYNRVWATLPSPFVLLQIQHLKMLCCVDWIGWRLALVPRGPLYYGEYGHSYVYSSQSQSCQSRRSTSSTTAVLFAIDRTINKMTVIKEDYKRR